ncbi:Smt3-specific protease [Orbilia blumenaviensis]|uniref:Smt3-specific protease n=1 Tax=Orbilia blumenaviensis TaxID=1796055 RepID=A0AAV9UMV1_9PEZI
MSESSNTTVSTVLDDSGTSSSSSSSSSASSDGNGKEDKAALPGSPVPPSQQVASTTTGKKEESAIMELVTNFGSILKSWFVGDKSTGRNDTNEEHCDDLVEERQGAGYTSKFEGNSRKRRRPSPPDDDDEQHPRVNGGIQKSKLQPTGTITTTNTDPIFLSGRSSDATGPKSISEQSTGTTTVASASDSVLENGTGEPGSLIAFTESKWKEQSQAPSLGPLKPMSAPSGREQLARSLARRNKAAQHQPKTTGSLAYIRHSLFGNGSRINKRSATPMSVSVRSRRQTSTPRRSMRDSVGRMWADPKQYSPPEATLSASFRSSVGSVGRGSTFTPSRSMRLEQSNLRSAKKLAIKKKPWLEQKEASGDGFDGASLMLYIQKLQESKVDGFENYAQVQDRQKIINDQIQQMRIAQQPQKEVLRDITDETLDELHVFLSQRNQLAEARLIGGNPINPRNLKTLNVPQWLNDEVINSYLHLIKERANKGNESSIPRITTMSSVFVGALKESGYKRVARWAKRSGAAGEQILQVKGVIIPIHRNMHWTLAYVNVEKKRFEYYDSLAGNWDPISLLRGWMRDEVGKKYKDEEWEDLYLGSQTPQQGNGFDCGVFLCKTAEVIARGGVMNFSQKDIPKIRKMMQVELLRGDLAAV